MIGGRARWGAGFAAIIAVAVAGAAVWGLVEGSGEAAREAAGENPAAPPRVARENGVPVITLDPDTQSRSGIVTASLPRMPYRREIRAYGTVLDLRALTELDSNYADAEAKLHIAEATLAAAQTAFERAQRLYKEQQNISAAQLQSAEATYRSDQAVLAAAQSRLRSVAAMAAQDWGPVIGLALTTGSAMLRELIERRAVLVQVTLPPGVVIDKAPDTAAAGPADDRRARLRLVSAAPRTDPRIQGLSFFYLAPAEAGLLPGLNLVVLLSLDAPITGTAIPDSAIVWLESRAWIYLRTGPQHFARRPIPTDLPAPQGGWVARDLPDPAPVVVEGAETLLSEEFRAQIEADPR